jgi:hypothetical protein
VLLGNERMKIRRRALLRAGAADRHGRAKQDERPGEELVHAFGPFPLPIVDPKTSRARALDEPAKNNSLRTGKFPATTAALTGPRRRPMSGADDLPERAPDRARRQRPL